MTPGRAFRICRVGGHVSFWLLIISTLFAGGLTWLVADDGSSLSSGAASYWERGSGITGYADAAGPVMMTNGESFATRIAGQQVSSSTAFASDYLPSDSQPFTLISVACAVAFVLAAWGETWLLRGQRRRFITALVPLVVLAILWYSTPGARPNVHLDPEVAFIFVLAAIAVREIWFRWAAPTLPAPTGSADPEEA